jgi:hypothetical protein
MAFRTTPSLGPGIETVIPANQVWFDIPGAMGLISPRLGSKVSGSDGHTYIMCQASAAIAAAAAPGTAITITEPTFQAAAGTQTPQYYAPNSTIAPSGVPAAGFFWARSANV